MFTAFSAATTSDKAVAESSSEIKEETALGGAAIFLDFPFMASRENILRRFSN